PPISPPFPDTTLFRSLRPLVADPPPGGRLPDVRGDGRDPRLPAPTAPRSPGHVGGRALGPVAGVDVGAELGRPHLVGPDPGRKRSEEHTSELQSREKL